jgi:choline-glycine betaine transporter
VNTTTTTIGLTAQQVHALNHISHEENVIILLLMLIILAVTVAAIGIGDAIERLQKESKQ